LTQGLAVDQHVVPALSHVHVAPSASALLPPLPVQLPVGGVDPTVLVPQTAVDRSTSAGNVDVPVPIGDRLVSEPSVLHNTPTQVAGLNSFLTSMQLPSVVHVVPVMDILQRCADVGLQDRFVSMQGGLLVDGMHASQQQLQSACIAMHAASQRDGAQVYWQIPCQQITTIVPLLAEARVVCRGYQQDTEFLLLSVMQCDPKVQLWSYVMSPVASLQVPLSLQVEPPVPGATTRTSKWYASQPEVRLTAMQQDGFLFLHSVEFDGIPCKALLDTGATRSFIDTRFVQKHGVRLTRAAKCNVIMGDGSRVTSSCVTKTLPLLIGSVRCDASLVSLPLNTAFDLVLGQDWLRRHRVVLDAGTGVVVVKGARVDPSITNVSAEPMDSATPDANVDASGMPALFTAAQFQRALRSQREAAVCVLQPVHEGSTSAAELDLSAANIGAGPVDRQAFQQLLLKYADRFQAIPPGAVANVGYVHTIPLQDGAQPINQRPYRTPQQLLPELEAQIADLLAKGWIRPSDSPWGSPVLFVPKKDGSWRMCIDYRALNKVTVKNSWPLPRIEDLLDKLLKAKVFSSFDLAQGYHQLAIDPSDVPKTAFKTPTGLYEYVVLPFGLTNAPATFSRKMQELFAAFMVGPDAFVLVYLDDILVFSENVQDHLGHVEQVLKVLRDANLFAKLKKCSFNQTHVEYLGHVVGGGTVAADPKKVSAVRDYPLPQTVTELRSFLGLANQFRRFVHAYAVIAAPLHAMTAGNLPKQTQLEWKQPGMRAFEKLKEALCTAPVLQIFDPCKDTQVVTDASGFAVGAVLLQDGLPVAYESRKLNVHECNYSVSDKELLAVKHALVAWRHYLLHKQFTVITDHRPNVTLQTCKSLADTSGRRARWAELLQQYHINWQYQPGESNIADVLSRSPQFLNAIAMFKAAEYIGQFALLQVQYTPGIRVSCATPMSRQHVVALNAMITRKRAREQTNVVVAPVAAAVEQADPNTVACGKPFYTASVGEDVQAQVSESTGGSLPCVLGTHHPAERDQRVDVEQPLAGPTTDSGFDHALLRRVQAAVSEQQAFVLKQTQQASAVLRDGLLWDVQGMLLIPPGPLREELIAEAHEPLYSGHVGARTTLHNLRLAQFAWPGMRTEVHAFVAKCDSCQRNKTSTQAPAGELQPLPIPNERWDTVTMDLITDLPVTHAKHDSIVVFVDKLSKMVEFVPCKKTIGAEQFAELFVNSVVLRFGVPRVIVSDRDPRFTAKFMSTVVKLLGTKQALSTAFHPQTDGQTEVMNRVLEQYLRHYVSAHCKDWDAYLPCAMFAVNNSRSSATGMTPFYLNYGRNPRTPLHDWQAVVSSKVPSAVEFRKRIADALAHAAACLAKSQQRMKAAADKRRRPAPEYKVGDEVLLSTRNLAFKGFKGANASKLLPRWVGPFQIAALVGKAAVKLNLLAHMKIHDVFHVSLVKPYKHGSTGVAPPPVMTLDNQLEYEIDRILDDRGKGRNKEYLVKWLGYPDSESSWELADSLQNAPDVVAAYELSQASADNAHHV
jgi:hypothetical protein